MVLLINLPEAPLHAWGQAAAAQEPGKEQEVLGSPGSPEQVGGGRIVLLPRPFLKAALNFVGFSYTRLQKTKSLQRFQEQLGCLLKLQKDGFLKGPLRA